MNTTTESVKAGRTLTGRLCYPLADLFLLQWPEQVRFYPRGQVIGCLL